MEKSSFTSSPGSSGMRRNLLSKAVEFSLDWPGRPPKSMNQQSPVLSSRSCRAERKAEERCRWEARQSTMPQQSSSGFTSVAQISNLGNTAYSFALRDVITNSFLSLLCWACHRAAASVCSLPNPQAWKGWKVAEQAQLKVFMWLFPEGIFVGTSLWGSTEGTKLLGGEWTKNVYLAFSH